MQDHTILIGGLDKTYMQKLALYLNERLENEMRVELAESRECTENKTEGQERLIPKKGEVQGRCWDVVIGTESFVTEMAGSAARSIIFSESAVEDETHIHPYQNREALYQKIVSRCVLHIGKKPGSTEHRTSKLFVFTGGCSAGQISAFAILCAWTWAKKIPVLYLELAECSGIAKLLHLQQDTADLSDLILALRRKEDLFPGGYIGRMDKLDYICPVGNPQVLHEMDEADAGRLLHCILNRNEGVAVLALGTMVRGCEQIFTMADRVFLLADDDLIEECALEEHRKFIQKCTGDRPVRIEEISAWKLRADTTGSQLLYEWMESEAGERAAKLLEEEENVYGDDLAGSAAADFGET